MSDNPTSGPITRRDALCRLCGGFGMVAFSNMAALSSMVENSYAQVASQGHGTPGALTQLHFKPRAKRVIFLFMNGGVSHVDTFDPKPMLDSLRRDWIGFLEADCPIFSNRARAYP